ncbi:MAG: hypothetical protein ACYCY3_05865 [Halothiobacillus sp.]
MQASETGYGLEQVMVDDPAVQALRAGYHSAEQSPQAVRAKPP